MNQGRIVQYAIPVRWRIVRTAPERTNLAAEVIPELSKATSGFGSIRIGAKNPMGKRTQETEVFLSTCTYLR